MWCRSIASGAVSLNQELPDHIWMWLIPPEKAPDKPEIISLSFENGVPVSLNNEVASLAELVVKLNLIAGRNGIGRIDIFEDGIMDLKSREIYEAPAAKVILKARSDIEAQCLTKSEREFKQTVDAKWAYLVYHGEWFHPLKDDLDAFIEQSQVVVNGSVKMKLYKGNIEFVERERSFYSLFYPEIRSVDSNSFTQKWAEDAANIGGLQFEILAKRAEKIKQAGK